MVCDEILKRCQGIPLFITGMADWLKDQQEMQQESSAFCRVEQVPSLLEQFEQALSPVYNDLPSYGQIMLMYMCMLPQAQGYMFDKDRLVMKWCHEGLVSYYLSDLFTKNAAERCLSILVDNNVVTQVAAPYDGHDNIHDEDEACLLQVNHFMLQFFASKLAQMDVLLTSATIASAVAAVRKVYPGRRSEAAKTLCLALHHPDPRLPTLLQAVSLSQIRSLTISGAVDPTMIPLERFICLRFLDLQGWENLKDEDLLQICKMYMLTYLSIRNTDISKLPPQIEELRLLQILDISHTQIRELPSEVFGLDKPMKLDLRSTQIKQLTLPEEIVQRDEAMHILVGGDGTMPKIPEGIRRFNIQWTVATVDLSECSVRSIEAYSDLLGSSVEELSITWSFHQCTDVAYQYALMSSIENCSQLESLTIHCGLGCSMEFMSSLPDPPRQLEKFKVTAGRFVDVPQWIKGLYLLVFLQINVCKLVPDDVKILGDLPRLQCLVLGLEFISREEIVIKSGKFWQLQRFSLDCPVAWLTFKVEAMQKLMYLQLKVCSGPVDQENAVPSGITNLQMLEEVVLCYGKWCKDSPSVKKTEEAVKIQVARHRNPIDLVINGIQQDVHMERERATENETKDDVPAEIEEDEDEEAVRTATQIQSEIETEGEIQSYP